MPDGIRETECVCGWLEAGGGVMRLHGPHLLKHTYYTAHQSQRLHRRNTDHTYTSDRIRGAYTKSIRLFLFRKLPKTSCPNSRTFFFFFFTEWRRGGGSCDDLERQKRSAVVFDCTLNLTSMVPFTTTSEVEHMSNSRSLC